jgi:hypothetical protein
MADFIADFWNHVGLSLKHCLRPVDSSAMSLFTPTLEAPVENATARPRTIVAVAHRLLERHLVTVVTLLVLAVALAASMHFPVYIGPLHGHPGR